MAQLQMETRIQQLVSNYDLQTVSRSAVDKMKKLNSEERQGAKVQGHSQSLTVL